MAGVLDAARSWVRNGFSDGDFDMDAKACYNISRSAKTVARALFFIATCAANRISQALFVLAHKALVLWDSPSHVLADLQVAHSTRAL
jgi:hypothetical protein